NICTAQVLLAVISSMYAAWHGPAGLRSIANRVHARAAAIAGGVAAIDGLSLRHEVFFDTIAIEAGMPNRADILVQAAAGAGYEVRRLDPTGIAIACDETTTEADVAALVTALGATEVPAAGAAKRTSSSLPAAVRRTDEILNHPVFSL